VSTVLHDTSSFNDTQEGDYQQTGGEQMNHLIEFPLEDGGTILVEVEQLAPEEGVVPATTPGEVVVKAAQTFEHALVKVKPAANAIINKLRGLSDPPDEIEVEFGLKLDAEAGAFVASVGAEANYKVTLNWKREKNKSE
jgi:hypothetical protein